MNQEISGKQIKVLPIIYQKCELPGFLLGKRYVSFADEAEYDKSFADLISSLGIVFNKRALESNITAASLDDAMSKANIINLPLLNKPFHRPFQYLGMTIANAEKEVSQKSNEVGNIIVDSEDCRMYLEAEGNFIQCIEVDLKKTAPQYQNKEFDSEPVLASLSINPAELDFVRKKTHFHTYYDHKRKLKISVSQYDGAPLSVRFSSKSYGG